VTRHGACYGALAPPERSGRDPAGGVLRRAPLLPPGGALPPSLRRRDARPSPGDGRQAGIPADVVAFLEREERETRAAKFARWVVAAKVREARLTELVLASDARPLLPGLRLMGAEREGKVLRRVRAAGADARARSASQAPTDSSLREASTPRPIRDLVRELDESLEVRPWSWSASERASFSDLPVGCRSHSAPIRRVSRGVGPPRCRSR
jgi:hypothetical protein